MIDLGIAAHEILIRQEQALYWWETSFHLRALGKWYRHEGTAHTPAQCVEAAEKYKAEVVREALHDAT